MNHTELLTELALALIDLGEPLPCDINAELLEQGVDVEGLYELDAQQTNHDNYEEHSNG